jgi:hypothetical protein
MLSRSNGYYEGPSGRIYIDWDEGYDWYVGRGNARDVRMIYSEDNGVTWSEPIVFAGESQTHKPIQIASAELLNGVLLVVWRYNSHASRIYYQISEDVGQTWSQPQPVPGLKARDLNDTPLDDYELITDNLGVGHLFVVGRAETDSDTTPPSLFHVEFRQGQWRRPVMVYRGDSANMPEWPKADIGPQNDIHLTWFIRHDSLQSSGPSTSRLQVYYSYRKPTQPLQPTLAFEPTTTPYPTSTPDYAPAPTLTPFPTAQPMRECQANKQRHICRRDASRRAFDLRGILRGRLRNLSFLGTLRRVTRMRSNAGGPIKVVSKSRCM